MTKICLKKISEIKTPNEYFEFVKQLQNLTRFPKTKEDNTGIYIVRKISTGIRKMKLGQAWIKEQENLALYKITPTNTIVRALEGNNRYVALDDESVICGIVCLLSDLDVSIKTQDLNIFYLTVFPIQIEISRKILNNPLWVPYVKFNSASPTIRNNFIVVPSSISNYNTFNVSNVTFIGSLNGSGIATTQLISSETLPAIPVTKLKIDDEITYMLQIPENNNASFTFNPVRLNSYNVFQVTFIVNQRNLSITTLTNRQTVLDLFIPIITKKV